MFLPTRGTGGEGAYGVSENKAEVRYSTGLSYLVRSVNSESFIFGFDFVFFSDEKNI